MDTQTGFFEQYSANMDALRSLHVHINGRECKYHRKQWLENVSSVRSDVYGGHVSKSKRNSHDLSPHYLGQKYDCMADFLFQHLVRPAIAIGCSCASQGHWECRHLRRKLLPRDFLLKVPKWIPWKKKHIGTNWLHQTLVTLFLSMLQSRSILFCINQSSRSWVSTPGS